MKQPRKAEPTSPAVEFATRWVADACDDNFRFGLLTTDPDDPVSQPGAVRGRSTVPRGKRGVGRRDLTRFWETRSAVLRALGEPGGSVDAACRIVADAGLAVCFHISDGRERLIEQLTELFRRGANAWDNGGHYAYLADRGLFVVHMWHDTSHRTIEG